MQPGLFAPMPTLMANLAYKVILSIKYVRSMDRSTGETMHFYPYFVLLLDLSANYHRITEANFNALSLSNDYHQVGAARTA